MVQISEGTSRCVQCVNVLHSNKILDIIGIITFLTYSLYRDVGDSNDYVDRNIITVFDTKSI